MKKLAKRTYKGIDYIRLDSLPQHQADALAKSLNPRTLIKIQKNDEVVADCVLYEVYEKWHIKFVEEASRQEPIPALNNSVSLT